MISRVTIPGPSIRVTARGDAFSYRELRGAPASPELLVARLNACARASNPAWMLYAAAFFVFCGLALIPAVPRWPELPEGVDAAGLGAVAGTGDEYASLTARFGEPDLLLIEEPAGKLPVGTARYTDAAIDVLFIPSQCLGTYRRLKSSSRCRPAEDSGWSTLRYVDTSAGAVVSARLARSRLDASGAGNATDPIVRVGRNVDAPPMRSTDQARASADDMRLRVRRALRIQDYCEAGLPIAAVLLALAGGFLHRRNFAARQTQVFYKLDVAAQARYEVVLQCLGLLFPAARRAGAVSPLRTNVPAPRLALGDAKMYFLPDLILCHNALGYRAISYASLRVVHSPVQPGTLLFSTASGVNLFLNTRTPRQSMAFAESWQRICARPEPEQTPACEPVDAVDSARLALGVPAEASPAEIRAAYRRLALMHHPDKLAGMEPDLQNEANRRMQEIGAAYQALKEEARAARS